jgi:hypothetical protein
MLPSECSDTYIYTIHGLIVFSLIIGSVLSCSCFSYQRVLCDGLVCLFRRLPITKQELMPVIVA